ncbi:MAG: alpha/beta hydrolase [Microthrixaceae bacterium]|nr:alpha/beta hydrolase [Microthrixaceae bacterium]
MPLERRVRALVGVLGRLDPEDRLEVPMAQRRAAAARLSRAGARFVMAPGPDPASVSHQLVPVEGGRILVRVHHPVGRGPHPLYVFLHGGGWCVGTLEERDPRCRAISAGARCAVATVDYRMAPENQFPTAPEDCYSALCWLVENASQLGIDSSRVAIGGESAGGNLAAVTCLMARDRDGPKICHQWLDVPATDATLSQEGHRAVGDGYLLDHAAIIDYLDHYLPSAELACHPYVSPLLAPDLSGLPPAWIMTAEFDQLRGDGEAYAAALVAAGGEATHVRLAGHVHPSFAFTRLVPSAAAYERDAIAALAAAFSR